MIGKSWIGVVLAIIAMLGALAIGRLSDQALAMLSGVLCGVLAGATLTAGIFWLSHKQQETMFAPQSEWRERPPQVVVLQQPTPPAASWTQGYLPPSVPEQSKRRFTIVGEEEEDYGNSPEV